MNFLGLKNFFLEEWAYGGIQHLSLTWSGGAVLMGTFLIAWGLTYKSKR